MKQTFTVTGMTCGHCEKSVKQAILALDTQAQVVIDRSQNRVEVQSEQAREKIAAAIRAEVRPARERVAAKGANSESGLHFA